MKNRAAQPKHICPAIGVVSTRRWAVSLFGPEVWLNWPLPVGRTANAGRVMRPFADGDGHEFDVAWAPLRDDSRAALILQADIGDTRVEMFAPARSELPDGRRTTSFGHSAETPEADVLLAVSWNRDVFTLRWQPLRWRVVGDPADAGVTRLMKAATRWWGPFIGQRVGAGGRPWGREIGLSDIDRARRDLKVEYKAAWLEGDVERVRVTNQDLATALGVSVRTIERVLREGRTDSP